MSAPSYLTKDRHGGYLFRIKIPSELLSAFGNKRVLIKSLKTYHRPTALKLARRFAATTQELFDHIKMSEKPLANQLAFAKAKLAIKRDQLDDINAGRVTVSNGKIRYTETTQSAQQIEALGDESLEIIVNEQSQLEQKIVEFKQQVDELKYQLDHVHKIKLQRRAEEIEGIASTGSIEQPTQIAELLLKIETLQNAIKPNSETPDSGLISELWEDFRNEKVIKGDWPNTKMANERRGQIRDFIEIIGGDIPASQVNRTLVLKTLEGLAEFPTYRGTRWKKYTNFVDVPRDHEDFKIISTDTQAQRIYNLSEFFGHLAKRKVIQDNPFAEYVMDRDSTNFATPTSTDIKEWFNLPEHLLTCSWHFWIPRLALFCGSRMGEIAQLTPNDVRQDKDTEIHYLVITDEHAKKLKSKAGKRKVPLHQDLIDNGFLDYCKLIKTKGLSTLWPSLKPKGDSIVGNITAYWASLRDDHSILTEPVNEQGQRKVFHSLRRVIQNKLNSDGVDLITIQTIVGHEPSLGSSKSYLDEPKPLHITNAALQKLKIEDVSWEHPKKFTVN